MLDSSFSGKDQCVNAFTVALGQACEGGKSRWYASTLELQLASLELCRACRSVPTLHVTVDDAAPLSLWTPRRSQTGPRTRRSKTRVLSRVPIVRALRLTWDLPLEDLVRRAAVELWVWSESPQLGGSSSASSMGSGEQPKGLEELVLNECLCSETVALRMVAWPVALQRLKLRCLNQPIDGIVWPASLQHLSFGREFNQPIAEAVWPNSLQHLEFGGGFNQPIAGVAWPASLQVLSLGRGFNQPIAGVWPPSFRRLILGSTFNQPIVGVEWPPSLEQLGFGNFFNQPIVGVKWPTSLQQLSFAQNFNQPIAGVVWPASLQRLSFASGFVGVSLPKSNGIMLCRFDRLLVCMS